MRTKAFKKWFGDWEKAPRIEKLRKSKNISISGKEIEITDDFIQNKKNAIEYGKKLKGVYKNQDTGKEVPLTSSKKNGGLYEILEHDYKNKEHILSIAAIPKIIEESIYIDTLANEDIEKHPNITSYDYYVCGLIIGDEHYTVKAVISNMSDGSRYYDHKLTSIEKGRLIDMIKEAPNSSVSISTQTPELSAVSGIKDNRLVSILQTDASKIVDANGEPLVVYHGSNWKGITTFDRSQSKRRRSGLREYGHFFTTNRALAEMYAAVEDAPDVKEEIDSLDAQIEQAAEAKDIGKMLDLYTEKERITRNLGGRVYEVFLNLRDVAEFDADYQADKGWYNLKADVCRAGAF